MDNQFEMVCPECGESDEIDIAATVWVRLCADGTAPDEAEDGDHTWDDASPCKCVGCGHVATVADFETNDED